MTDIFQPAQYVHIHTDAANPGPREQLPVTQELNLHKIVSFSGVALGRFGFIDGDFSYHSGVPREVEELADASGEWMAVAMQETDGEATYVIFGDASGFCPIFFSKIPGDGVVISDSFHGVVRGRAAAGKAVSLNIDHYIATATAHHPHFDNPSVQQTMANEIEILRKDEALVITVNGVHFIPRASLGIASSIDNYTDALIKGVESIRESLQMLSQQQAVTKTINFSGGVDSRMALSLITSAGLKDSFSINTSDPRTWHNPHTRDTIERDIAIANKIREDLGMSWTPKGSTKQLQFDFQDSIAFHQGFRSNFSFNFRPIYSHSISEAPFLTIRGGGGELLRATATGSKVASQIRELYPTEEGQTSNSALVKKWYLRRSLAKGEARDIVNNYFTGLENHFQGHTLEESLNFYYQQTRNRTHFGHLRQSHTTNNTSIHLLANSYFLRAGELLPFDVKRSGKLVKDIFEETDPSLLNYPFESDEATRELSKEGYRHISNDYKNWQEKYDAALKQPRTTEQVPHWSSDVRGIISPYDKVAAAESYMARAFRVIEDLSDGEHTDSIRSVHQVMKRKASANQTHLFNVVAKLASAVDLRFPILSNGNAVHLRCDLNGAISTGRLRVNLSNRPVPQDGWNDKPVMEVKPTLSIANDKFLAEVETGVPVPAGTRFAFHLYRGREKVDQSWYADTQRRVFSADLHPGKYTVRAYVRSSGNLKPSYSFVSDPIFVEK